MGLRPHHLAPLKIEDFTMTAKDFCAWLDHMKLNDSAATRALGLGSRHTLARYKTQGAPRHIALACAALAFGLPPWKAAA